MDFIGINIEIYLFYFIKFFLFNKFLLLNNFLCVISSCIRIILFFELGIYFNWDFFFLVCFLMNLI